MKLKVTLYVSAILISVLVILYFVNVFFTDSRKEISKPVQKEIIKDSLPAGGNPNSTDVQYTSDTAQISGPPKTKSDKKIKNNNVLIEKIEPEIKLIAFYFHPTARCQTCLNIENFTKEVIQTQFEKEVKGGIITFRALNIEDSVNEHFINDYNLQFSSLILGKFVNNNQTKWKNLEHVWKFANDKEQFHKYVSIEIKGYLKEKE